MTLPARTTVIACLAAVFLAGAVAGGFAGYGYGRREGFRRPPGAEHMAGRVRDHLAAELQLTPDQVRKVEPIVNDTMAELMVLHQTNFTRVCELIRRSNERIAPLLTPDQRAKLDAMNREREQRRPKFGDGPPRGRGDHGDRGPGDGRWKRRDRPGPPERPPGEPLPPPPGRE